MPNRTADAARVQATLSRLGFDRFHPTPILWSGSMRGCSLMVKPQSSKLITRVRFPSSPRGLGSRRFRVEALFFFPRGDDGNPFRMRICFLARSESARSSSSSPPQIPLGDAGNRLRLKVPKAFETFRLQPVIPSRTNLRESLPGENAFPRALGASENLLRGSIYSDISAGSTEFRPGSRGTSRACVRRFLPCGWWCRIVGTPRPGACIRSSRARARPRSQEYRGGPRARW